MNNIVTHLLIHIIWFIWFHLLQQDDKGKFNFDQSKVTNPETGEPVSLSVSTPVFNSLFSFVKETKSVCVCVFVLQVSNWYRGSETWDSKFSTIASSYEECRAECVGLYLCLKNQVLRCVMCFL